MTSSPTLQDQEFPDNSIVNGSCGSIVSQSFDLGGGGYNKHIYNEFDSILSISIQQQKQREDLVDSPGSCFESILPDHLTQDNNNNLIINESVLERELETLRKTNEIFENINDNMDQSSENLQQFSSTVEQSDRLLDIWINILSQSIRTQNLLSDPLWQGLTAEKDRILEDQAKEKEKQEQLERFQQEQLEREQLERKRIEPEEVTKTKQSKLYQASTLRINPTTARGRKNRVRVVRAGENDDLEE
ncbi:4864_t:CDS:2 [Diversispora eburnea]|uniref:DASH complex subunit DUO1 n=1 Tax=Diversispora eburnea TaxID=1213867 RepID=A0A9N8ZVE9_9GLOM|nr:4864_t:CDS:2 [Diversispora eburnea]